MAQLIAYQKQVDGTILAIIDGKSFTASADHPRSAEIWDTIVKIEDGDTNLTDSLPNLFSMRHLVESFISESKRLKIERDKLYYLDVTPVLHPATGEVVEGTSEGEWVEFHTSFVDRFVKSLRAGEPVQRMAKFLERLAKNPFRDQIKEPLFNFMSRGSDHHHVMLYPDGRLRLYKKVQTDLTPFHHDSAFTQKYVPLETKYAAELAEMEANGKTNDERQAWLLTQPGHLVYKRETEMDSDTRHLCSAGLHAGRTEYTDWWNRGQACVIMAVAVDPSDIYAAFDGGDWKVRARIIECREEVDQEDHFKHITHVSPTPVHRPFSEELPEDPEDMEWSVACDNCGEELHQDDTYDYGYDTLCEDCYSDATAEEEDEPEDDLEDELEDTEEEEEAAEEVTEPEPTQEAEPEVEVVKDEPSSWTKKFRWGWNK